jgi:hypothetical protein
MTQSQCSSGWLLAATANAITTPANAQKIHFAGRMALFELSGCRARLLRAGRDPQTHVLHDRKRQVLVQRQPPTDPCHEILMLVIFEGLSSSVAAFQGFRGI